MTEQELQHICQRWGATLRKRTKSGRKSPAYEAYRGEGGRTHMVYLFAVSKLPEASTEAVESKLLKLYPSGRNE
jgi:hypothetical protein